MKYYGFVAALAVTFCLSVGSGAAFADKLVWQTSKAEAVSMALSQGRQILLLAGRDTCPYCVIMKNEVCESVSPPIKGLIEQHYVPWYCDVRVSDEYKTYTSGLNPVYIPLVCVIDPKDSNNFLDRTIGQQDLQVFYSRLYADRNVKTDLADAILSMRISVGISSTDADISNIDDIDNDRKIGMAEAIHALQKAAGLR